MTVGEIAERLALSQAGVRRHLEALVASGDAAHAPTARGRGRGRPARAFLLTPAGRARQRHSYDDLAVDAIAELRRLGGDAAVLRFARRRVDDVVGAVRPSEGDSDVAGTAERIAVALTDAGYATSVRRVGNGVQICQHHCPVSRVAEAVPEICEAEAEAFAAVLGTHVQRLATIANGDCACTTHVPLGSPPVAIHTTAAGVRPGTRGTAGPGKEAR